MKSSMRVGSGILTLFLALATSIVPGQVYGKEKARGQAKKNSKFVNGHDARDGRWDGKGPKPGKVHGQTSHRHKRHHKGKSHKH